MLLGNPRPIHESDLGHVMEGAILHVQRQQGIHDDDCNEIKTMHAPALYTAGADSGGGAPGARPPP